MNSVPPFCCIFSRVPLEPVIVARPTAVTHIRFLYHFIPVDLFFFSYFISYWEIQCDIAMSVQAVDGSKPGYIHSDPFDAAFLKVDAIHSIHYEQYGLKTGLPGEYFQLCFRCVSTSVKTSTGSAVTN